MNLTTKHNWPYDRTFKALAAAVKWQPEKHLNVSVERFAEAFGPRNEPPPDGFVLVPIKPTDAMLEELARIGDGPMISGAEVWGYMLAAASANGKSES